jgi:flavocytochrome c
MRATRLVALGAALLASAVLFVGCGGGPKYDVVIVGSGAAGLSAAIEAAGAGAKVAVLEKLPMPGGSTLLSGGIVYGTGSTAQKNLNIQDSVDALVQYWSDRAGGQNDQAKVKFVAERSGATIDWMASLGVKFADPVPAGISPVRRAHTSPDGGVGLVNPLKKAADAKNVAFFMETAATKLLTDKGAVVGVAAKDKNGKAVEFRSKTVILATGGFDRNTELMAKYAADYQTDLTFVGTGNTGDGLLMAQAVGAAVEGKGGVIGFRGVPGESSFTTDVSLLIWRPYLTVNKEGKRFVNETVDYPIFHQALNKQADKMGYIIFDANTFEPPLQKAVDKGVAFGADTIEALAKAAGIDEKGLAASVAAYNKAIATGKDAEFGRAMKGLKPVKKGKFYALKVKAATLGTMSGLKTDLDTRVLNEKGEAIKGLFAAGEVANGGFFNQEYPASGTSIQMSLTFGRVAGTAAAAAAKK